MYKPSDVAARIKAATKSKGFSVAQMLKECDLSPNTVTYMVTRDSWIGANALAVIADFLDISTDDLLGRKKKASPKGDALVDLFLSLNDEGQQKVLSYAQDLASSGNYKKDSARVG